MSALPSVLYGEYQLIGTKSSGNQLRCRKCSCFCDLFFDQICSWMWFRWGGFGMSWQSWAGVTTLDCRFVSQPLPLQHFSRPERNFTNSIVQLLLTHQLWQPNLASTTYKSRSKNKSQKQEHFRHRSWFPILLVPMSGYYPPKTLEELTKSCDIWPAVTSTTSPRELAKTTNTFLKWAYLSQKTSLVHGGRLVPWLLRKVRTWAFGLYFKPWTQQQLPTVYPLCGVLRLCCCKKLENV